MPAAAPSSRTLLSTKAAPSWARRLTPRRRLRTHRLNAGIAPGSTPGTLPPQYRVTPGPSQPLSPAGSSARARPWRGGAARGSAADAGTLGRRLVSFSSSVFSDRQRAALVDVPPAPLLPFPGWPSYRTGTAGPRLVRAVQAAGPGPRLSCTAPSYTLWHRFLPLSYRRL